MGARHLLHRHQQRWPAHHTAARTPDRRTRNARFLRRVMYSTINRHEISTELARKERGVSLVHPQHDGPACRVKRRRAQDLCLSSWRSSTRVTGSRMAADPDRSFTLPQVAAVADVEYRTLHLWLRRGILTPTKQAASGSGSTNLF